MSGHNFARHMHVVARLEQFNTPGGTVLFGGGSLLLLVFTSVWYLVWILNLSRLLSCWVAVLCHTSLRTLRNLWLHMDNRCGQVSLLLFGHSV